MHRIHDRANWGFGMMVVRTMLVAVVVFGTFCRATAAQAEKGESETVAGQRNTFTGGFRGLPDAFVESGLELDIAATSIYQQNGRGGMSTGRRSRRWSGSYDLEVHADLQRLLGFEDASLYVHAEGLWSKSGGIDGPAVGSAFGVNADGGARRAIDVTEIWYEQSMLGGKLLWRLGKLDLTGGFQCRGCPAAFDGSLFANDETSQFLNGALVNNPTIPFPENGLGVSVLYNPSDSWYAAAGIADAQSDSRETGFRTAFHGPDYFFYIFETGVTPAFDSAKGPLQGAYRIGLWNDPQPKANSDRAGTERGDVGFYVSADQVLTKENDDPADSQGAGVFFRYGHADSRKNDITNFWSMGFQYQGLFDGRDEDVLGVGYAQGFFSDTASARYPEDSERAVELYYNARINPYLNISPGIQYISNPGGARGGRDAVVFGVRMELLF